jgi:hypothetical protein
VVAEGSPQASGLHEDRETDLLFELDVLRRIHVANDGVTDVGIDVERGGGCGPSSPSTRRPVWSATETRLR